MQRPDTVQFRLKATSKKHLLQRLADALATTTGLDSRELYDRLVEREKLGSTGLGGGIAIPHARMEGLDRVYTVFATLEDSVDYESIDAQPVDLVFALIAPIDAGADHLQALAAASRMLRSKEFCARVRGASSEDAVTALWISEEAAIAA
jgi:nitrogen PTS system EIIA component